MKEKIMVNKFSEIDPISDVNKFIADINYVYIDQKKKK